MVRILIAIVPLVLAIVSVACGSGGGSPQGSGGLGY
jgi:hypothetical protein